MESIDSNYIEKLREEIDRNYFLDEKESINFLLNKVNFNDSNLLKINESATRIMNMFREIRQKSKGIDAFLVEYDLSSEEGIALMCLAEALLRVPDKTNIDKLIKDKLSAANWGEHVGKSSSIFVNAATFALMLTGKVISEKSYSTKKYSFTFKNLLQRTGEPFIRQAVKQSMEILSKQFILGETIESAFDRAGNLEQKGMLYSYDMLGEAAVTMEDAEIFFNSYKSSIEYIGKNNKINDIYKSPGISVKLSALHPRYEWKKKHRVILELIPKLKELVILAREFNVSIVLDAEEADRLDISLDIIEEVLKSDILDGWSGFGIAVQAYQKRAYSVIEWFAAIANKYNKKVMLRLVKGAYWDSEIKLAQEQGMLEYPVFTRKESTDVSYIACAKKILEYADIIYPQFATHNAHTIAAILTLANHRNFEFQCLHGMGDSLYESLIDNKYKINCRVYAPVGDYECLLPYLVRRLLENGANSSFVNRISDLKLSVNEIISDPIAKVSEYENKQNSKIPLPIDLYGRARENSKGINLSYKKEVFALLDSFKFFSEKKYISTPTFIFESDSNNKNYKSVISPIDNNFVLGSTYFATADDVNLALSKSCSCFEFWSNLKVAERSSLLEKTAKLLWKQKEELIYLLVKEAGKAIPDAINELRETIDFCNYYASRAKMDLSTKTLTGPTGELNQIKMFGRGIIACISPWNFPLAIFLGQVSAALVAGNCVVAKPASQTTLIASKAVEIMHQAGIPKEVVQLITGSAKVVGNMLVNDTRVKGVMLTGSTETAKIINKNLANRPGDIVPLIAETGGQNAMIVDSSALTEQVVKDVVDSAFGSAGQRCSALRVLYLQEDIADRVIKMLVGAMQELQVNDTTNLESDIGPVIDKNALISLNDHIDRMNNVAKLIYKVPIDEIKTANGSFFAPCVYEIESISILEKEVFGPVLHIIRFNMSDLDKVIADINSTGFGLTFGIHSRINDTIEYVTSKVKAGNIYINRNIVGAVVGVQPFGGEGMSGTGPKAGGPNYLQRLCVERVFCNNIVAVGGNASLLSLT